MYALYDTRLMRPNNGVIVTSDKFKLCVTGQGVIDMMEQIAAYNLATEQLEEETEVINL